MTRRHVVLAVEDSNCWPICTEHQLEAACRCRQPVGNCALREPVRCIAMSMEPSALGTRPERWPPPSDRLGCSPCTLQHQSWSATRKGYRPGRELSYRKMQDVIALAGEPPPRAVDGRRPVRRLLRHIDGGQHFGACGP